MKNVFKKILVSLFLIGMLGPLVPLAFAQGTILPKASDVTKCNDLITTFNNSGKMKTSSTGASTDIAVSDTLGCAIVTGKVSVLMLPYFIQYFSNYLLGMVSLIALLFVVIGGFMYSAGELIEKKDKDGKVVQKYPKTVNLFYVRQVEKVG